MKRLFFLISTALLITTYLTAKDVSQHRQEHETQAKTQKHTYHHKYFMFENGKLYQFDGSKRMMITKTMTFENGLKVHPNGTYQIRNMKEMQLKDGECLDMKGQRYSNQEMIRQHFRTDSLNREKHKTEHKEMKKETPEKKHTD